MDALNQSSPTLFFLTHVSSYDNWLERHGGNVYEAAQQLFEQLEFEQWKVSPSLLIRTITPQVINFVNQVKTHPPAALEIIHRAALHILIKSLESLKKELSDIAELYNTCFRAGSPFIVEFKENVAIAFLSHVQANPSAFANGYYDADTYVYSVQGVQFESGRLFSSIASWVLSDYQAPWLYNAIIEGRPNQQSPLVHLLKAYHHVKYNEPHLALTHIDLYLSFFPKDTTVLKMKSLLMLQLNQYEAAATIAKQVAENSKTLENLKFLGNLYWRINRLELAQITFTCATHIGNDSETQLALAYNAKIRKIFPIAHAHCTIAHQIKPNPKICLLAAKMYIESKELAKLKQIKNKISAFPNSLVEINLFESLFQFYLKNYKTAYLSAQEGLKSSPYHSELHLAAAKASACFNNTLIALNHLEKASIYLDRASSVIVDEHNFSAANVAWQESTDLIEEGNGVIKQILQRKETGVSNPVILQHQLYVLKQFGYRIDSGS